MASTNKTTNYELSQFQSSDIPAWLTDYNGDMQKIDTGIHAAKVQAEGAASGVSALQTAVSGKQDRLTFDSSPISGSSNPVTSGGIYEALRSVSVQTDAVPTAGSTKAVQSGGVYTALQGKQNALTATRYTLTDASGISSGVPVEANIYGNIATVMLTRKIINSSAWVTATLSAVCSLCTVAGNIFNLTTSSLSSVLTGGQAFRRCVFGNSAIKTAGTTATTINVQLFAIYDGTNTIIGALSGNPDIVSANTCTLYPTLYSFVESADGQAQVGSELFTFLISAIK